MARGKHTVKNKVQIFEEALRMLDIDLQTDYFSSGSTVTGKGLNKLLEEISFRTGIPPKGISSRDEKQTMLVHKSTESFILSLDIIGRTYIPYRLETFCVLLINSWELLLKAKLLKSRKNIYLKNNPNRTLAFSNCVKKVFTGNKHIRENLLSIESIRNDASHLFIRIIPSSMVPLLQASIVNYKNKIKDWFNRDITKVIPEGAMILMNESENEKLNFLSTESLSYLAEWESKIRKTIKSLPENQLGQFFMPIKIQIDKFKNPTTSMALDHIDNI